MLATPSTSMFPQEINIFGLKVELLWQAIANKPEPSVVCAEEHFYLRVTDVAEYWVNPQKNQIIIERTTPEISYSIVATWLLGTVMAYLLQYHGYLVLHGSAVLINDHAVIISGESGAGKSTLAAALVKQGYYLLTDDVVVVKANENGQMEIVPGPAKLKLWSDALEKLEYDSNNLEQVINKADKFQFPVTKHTMESYPISRFYELNPVDNLSSVTFSEILGIEKLQLLIKNTYRYGMLKALNKFKQHFISCSELGKQIKTFKIMRPVKVESLTTLVQLIENHN